MSLLDHHSKKIVLVGNPNVGKSVVFRLLTGSYVLVSNFPGTTVEVSRGACTIGGVRYEVVDTPGCNSLVPQSEEERVSCELLQAEKPDLILQVADAKNLRRTLLITCQLAELGIPLVLILNMMDEAEERGVEIESQGLSRRFGIQVVEMVAIYSQGKKKLAQAIQKATVPINIMAEADSVAWAMPARDGSSRLPVLIAAEWLMLSDRNLTRQMEKSYGAEPIARLRQKLDRYREQTHLSPAREVAAARSRLSDNLAAQFRRKRHPKYLEASGGRGGRLWLAALLAGLGFFLWNEFGPMLGVMTPFQAAGDFIGRHAGQAAPGRADFVRSILLGDPSAGGHEFGLIHIAIHLLFFIVPVVLPLGVLMARDRHFVRELGILTRRAATGFPILLVVLLLVYEFVGFTGAQMLVALLENSLFRGTLVPFLQGLIPEGFFHSILVGRYGLVSVGLSYAIAIVLPVVATFFIAFGWMEDSGYLPRLAVLSDRLMRVMGLNGKATLPMVLGLGCCTMATLTTRILNSRKERLIATLLLALGIPCSAQLGVILGISASFSFKATLTVLGVVATQLLLVGYLSSKLLRGRASEFIFEIPPIRVPVLRNVLLKTGHRVKWYLMEAVPLFLYGTLALFFLDFLHAGGRSLLMWLEAGLEPVLTGILHLPAQAASVFVLGFLRRDYGAAGLFAMVHQGSLTAEQAVVSLIVITLFVPCLASFLVICREQGPKRAVAITGFILPFAISVGGAVSWFLRTLAVDFR